MVKKKILWLLIVLIAFLSLFKILSSGLKLSESNLIYKNIKVLENSDIKSDFVFAVIGDNKNSISTFGKIIKRINQDPEIKFVINTGDMVFDGNLIKYNFYLKQIKQLNVPLLTVPGNHDVADNGVENYLKIFGPLYYSFHLDQAYFIILNNSNEKEVDPFQMEWLKNELKNSQSYKFRFVFMHVPLYDPRVENQPGHSMKNIDNAKQLLQLFKQYEVTMFFTGHIHGYFSGNWDGVPFIITGGAGAELVGLDPNHYFYHYIKIYVGKDFVKYDLIKLDSPDFNLVDRIFAFIWLYMYSFIVINFWTIMLVISFFVIVILTINSKLSILLKQVWKVVKESKIAKIMIKSSRIIRKFIK